MHSHGRSSQGPAGCKAAEAEKDVPADTDARGPGVPDTGRWLNKLNVKKNSRYVHKRIAEYSRSIGNKTA